MRLLARREAQRRLLEVADDELKQRTTDFRIERGLHFRRDLDRWLTDRGLDRQAWAKLIEDEALVSKLTEASRVQLERYVIDQLRTEGDYTRLAARAQVKRTTLLAAGNDLPGDANTMESLRALVWYFEQHLGRGVPDDIDAYATNIGFDSAAAFHRAVGREHRFQLVNDEVCNQ